MKEHIKQQQTIQQTNANSKTSNDLLQTIKTNSESNDREAKRSTCAHIGTLMADGDPVSRTATTRVRTCVCIGALSARRNSDRQTHRAKGKQHHVAAPCERGRAI